MTERVTTTEHGQIFNTACRLLEHPDFAIVDRVNYALSLGNSFGWAGVFYQLARSADFINPYKRKNGTNYRQMCLRKAVQGDYRCQVAQMFYELSEGMYAGSTWLPYVLKSRRTLQL